MSRASVLRGSQKLTRTSVNLSDWKWRGKIEDFLLEVKGQTGGGWIFWVVVFQDLYCRREKMNHFPRKERPTAPPPPAYVYQKEGNTDGAFYFRASPSAARPSGILLLISLLLAPRIVESWDLWNLKWNLRGSTWNQQLSMVITIIW